jgi:diguanylate cyclase (GGDEF)-like protein
MQPPAATFPVVIFLGVVVQLIGGVLLVVLFALLRRYTLRRGYFTAWVWAWTSLTVAILALVSRYVLVDPAAAESDLSVRLLYVAYQTAKAVAFICFLRGTAMYVAGGRVRDLTRPGIFAGALAFGVASAFIAEAGLNELVIWQSLIAVPSLGYCASALLWLPPSRRSLGTVATGTGFGLLALLWLVYAGAFSVIIGAPEGALRTAAIGFVNFNSYYDLLINICLGYGMVVLLMEDAKREVDDAQAELRLAHDQFRRAALLDPLTDAWNRRAYTEGVSLEMVRATFGTAVLADVDNLKYVNDRFGHAVGDALLARCVDVLRHALRPYDKLYRWGGDEFLLLMPSARAMDVIERLQGAIRDAEPLHVDGQRVHLEVSFGAADYPSGEELTAAINGADRAMYQEKARRKSESGRTGSTSAPVGVNAVR